MTRGTRLLILVLVMVGVIVLMMDCAKKTMRKRKAPAEVPPQSLFIPES